MPQGKKADFTLEQLERLGRLNPTTAEIAAAFGISERTVQRYLQKQSYAEALRRGRGHRLIDLKRAQWRSAIDRGSVAMQIWLGKNELGQSDDPGKSGEEPLPWPE